MPTIAELLAAKPKTIDGLPDFLKAAAYGALAPQPSAVPSELANLAPVTKGEDTAQAQEPNTNAPAMSGVNVDAPNIHSAGTSKVQLTQDEANSLKSSPIPAPIAQAAAAKSSPLSEVPPVSIAQATQPTKLDKGLRIAGAVAAGAQALGRGGDSGAKLLMESHQNQAANQLEVKRIEASKENAQVAAGSRVTVAEKNNAAKIEVQDKRQAAAKLNSDIKAIQSGLVKDASTGDYRQPNAEELSGMPLKQAIADKLLAQADEAEAQAVKSRADADVKMNPNNPTFQQNQKKIEAQLAMAQRKIQQADQRIALASKNTQLHEASVFGSGGMSGNGVGAGTGTGAGKPGAPAPVAERPQTLSEQRFGIARAKFGNTIYEPALTADTRLKQMYEQAARANAGDAASDQALLFNHIAMTGGNVKGLRMGEHLTEAHRLARGLDERFSVAWNQLSDGESLSPQQRANFVHLGEEVRQTTWDKTRRQAAMSGMTEEPPLDSDLPPLKPLNTPGGAPATSKPNGGGGKFSVTDPNGKVHPFNSQAEANNFKKLIGQ